MSRCESIPDPGASNAHASAGPARAVPPRGDTSRFPGMTASCSRDTAPVAASAANGAGYGKSAQSWKRITPGNRANT